MTGRNFKNFMFAGLLALPLLASAAAPVIEVYKTPTCGCCKEWMKHLQANGFQVKAHDVDNTAPYRAKAGIPEHLGSCHTAKVGGYAIEGHVPAGDIKRLLDSRQKAIGLTAPGMPMGSPGMEGPHKDQYDVLLVKEGGKTTVFQRHNQH